MRGKQGMTAHERLQKLLHSGLFHLVRDKPELLDKVIALDDMQHCWVIVVYAACVDGY